VAVAQKENLWLFPFYLEAAEKARQLHELREVPYWICVPIAAAGGPALSFVAWELVKGLGLLSGGVGTVSTAMAAGVSVSGKNVLLSAWNAVAPAFISFDERRLQTDAILVAKNTAMYTNTLIEAAAPVEIKVAFVILGCIVCAVASIFFIEAVNRKRREERRVIVATGSLSKKRLMLHSTNAIQLRRD
jgi:hypothetical protein